LKYLGICDLYGKEVHQLIISVFYLQGHKVGFL
jgi:hypothetical protein